MDGFVPVDDTIIQRLALLLQLLVLLLQPPLLPPQRRAPLRPCAQTRRHSALCLSAVGRCREHAPRSGGHYYAGTPLGVWRTADEPMVLIAYQPKDFATLCQVRIVLSYILAALFIRTTMYT